MRADIEKQESKSKAVVLTEDRARKLDNLEKIGKQTSTFSVIIGQQLKFVKGDWIAGEDKATTIPLGTKLVFNADSVTNGWQRWESGKVVDAVMGAVVDGFQAPFRNELSQPPVDGKNPAWPTDDQGFQKDPWSKSIIALLKEPGKKGQVYTLTIGSKGGLSAMGELMKKTSEGMRERGEMFPVVTLGASSYYNKKFKTDVDVPVFQIVGWVPVSDFDVPLVAKADEEESYEGDEGEPAAKKAPTAKKTKPAANKAKGKVTRGDGRGERDIAYE